MSAASTPITPEAAAAFNAANAAFREGRFEAARDAAARAAQLAPDLAIAHVLKARALRRIGDEPAARAAYDAALAADPASFDALLERGNVLRGLGEAAEAAASYSRAMAARPLDVRPALALARLWEEQPGQDAAEQAAIALPPAPDRPRARAGPGRRGPGRPRLPARARPRRGRSRVGPGDGGSLPRYRPVPAGARGSAARTGGPASGAASGRIS